MKDKTRSHPFLTLLIAGVAAAMLAACSAEIPDPSGAQSPGAEIQTAESSMNTAAGRGEAAAPAAATAAGPTPVSTPAPAELVLKGSDEVTVGAGIQLCPLTEDGLDVDTASLTWQSSDESVAIVTNGWIDALRPGSVTITASGTGYLPVTREITVRQIVCTYCGQSGHTASTCSRKAADEQAAQAAAEQAAADQAAAAAAQEAPAPEETSSGQPGTTQEGICPVCGSQLNPDGSCNVIHEYAGYAMAYYDEEAGQVYIVCNGCGQRFWRSDFSDPVEFALSHGYPCCSRFDAGGGM